MTCWVSYFQSFVSENSPAYTAMRKAIKNTMPMFHWFTKKPVAVSSTEFETSGLGHVDAAVPFNPARKGRSNAPIPISTPSIRKTERHERLELLYPVVRESMTQAGVLSSSYKFKV